MNALFWRSAPPPTQTSRPIYCTKQFKEDIDRIYGDITRYDNEASAYAHVIGGSAVFYKCEELPEEMMHRQRAFVSTRMDTPEVRNILIDELKRTQGRSRYVSVHDHPMNFPNLSTCDVTTYEHCRTSESEPSPLGCNNPYPVILINLSADEEIELLGFWVIDGCAYRTNVIIISDDSSVVTEAWANAPQLAYYSPEAELARKIASTLYAGWSVVLGINATTKQKALLVMNPQGEKKAIPFSNSPLGLEYDELWKYVDWQRMFVDCIGKTMDDASSAKNASKHQKARGSQGAIRGKKSKKGKRGRHANRHVKRSKR